MDIANLLFQKVQQISDGNFKKPSSDKEALALLLVQDDSTKCRGAGHCRIPVFKRKSPHFKDGRQHLDFIYVHDIELQELS